MRARIFGLALLATLAACGDDGQPSDGEIRACLEETGAVVRPAGDWGELLLPAYARGLFLAQWDGRRRSAIVMRSDSEEAARRAEDALKRLLPQFRVDGGNVRRAGTLVVSASHGPPSDEVMDCVT
ncbi:MAG TPA: hypothetical protein VHF89_01675 [Solirubrobacteraceae bacterium]|nr:hypothetical protein [Solirubrobacteraceae bacterium]